MTSVNVTTTKNTVTVNGETRVVTVKTQGPQGPSLPDGDKGDVTVSSNGTAISINNSAVTSAKIADGAIVDADINASAAIALTKLATGALPTAITVTSANISDLSIVDADISASAAISLSKLATGALPTAITVTSANISDLSIVNADINASAAIAGTKISPDFGSQNIVTTGTAATGALGVTGNLTVSGTVDGVDVATRDALFGGLTSSSGVLSNGVTATTQSASDNSTKVATTAYTDTAISNLINGAPAALDTLNELAAALNDDAAFSTTVTNSIATKMPLAGGQFTGNVTFSGTQTVDGRDLSVDGAKLDGIESGATADQTKSDIDALGIAASTATTLATARTIAGTSFDGSANIDISYTNLTNKLSVGDGGLTQNNFTDALKTKLDGVETGATADQTASEIKTAYESNSDTNAFTDADHTKLDGIEASATADQTAAEIKILLDSNGIVNSNVDASAAIAGSKIDPSFTSNLQITRNAPTISFNESDASTDYEIKTQSGVFKIKEQGGSDRLSIASDGTVDVDGNLDVGAGVDVTGNITVSGTVDGVDIATRDTLFGGLTSSSGVLTNGVIATTQSASDNSTKVATTAYTDTAVANLVDSAPGTLNTLNELAAALGDDPNFATTVTNSIATKLPLAGGQITGNITCSGSQTFDGRDLSVDGTKLDGIESGATADQTASEIVSLLSDQNITTTGTLASGDLTLTDVSPSISFTDSNNNPDFSIYANGGILNFHDDTNSTVRMRINADGHVDVIGHLDVGAGIDVTGNITVTGTVDGRDLATDGTKLDGIESNATADQTASEIVALVADQTIAPSEIDMEDNEKILLGTGDDLEIYHSSDISRIRNTNDSGTLKIQATSNGENAINIVPNGTTELYFDGTKKLETTSTGATVTGTLIADGLTLYDNEKLLIGSNTDIEVFHDGTNSIFQSDTGDLQINSGNSAGNVEINVNNNVAGNTRETSAKFIKNGAVELYYDNSKKLHTVADGIYVTGNIYSNKTGTAAAISLTDNGRLAFGSGADLQIYHDGSNSRIHDAGTGILAISGNQIDFQSANQGESLLQAVENGAVKLRYDNSTKLETTSTGATLTGALTTTGNINVPTANSVVTGSVVTTNATALTAVDNGTAYFGTGLDLRISHTGTNSYITNTTGTLFTLSNIFEVKGSDGNETHLKTTNDGAVELYYDNSVKLATTGAGVDINGNLNFDDNEYALFGNSNDLQIYHDGNNSKISHVGTGGLYIGADTFGLQKGDHSENYISMAANGAVELYYDNSKKLETTAIGVTISGDLKLPDNENVRLGDSNDLILYHNGTNSLIENATGELRIKSSDQVLLQKYGTGESMVRAVPDNTVELRYDNSKKFETTSTGAAVTGELDVSGTIDMNTDTGRLKLGAGDDLSLWHDGSNSYIANTSGQLRIWAKTDGYAITCTADGSVDLYYNNARKFRTVSDGCEITSAEAGDACLALIADEGDDNADYFRLKTANSGGFYLQNYAAGSWETNIKAIGNGAVELYYDNSKKFETTSYGNLSAAQVRVASSNATTVGFSLGDVGTGFYNSGSNAIGYSANGTQKWNINSAGDLNLADNVKGIFGDGLDLQIYHDGSNSYIQDTDQGNLFIEASAVLIRKNGTTENIAKFIQDGAVELYYDTVKKFETTTNGIAVTDRIETTNGVWIGSNQKYRLYDNSGVSRFDTYAYNIEFVNKGTDGSISPYLARMIPAGAVELYHNGSKKFETTSAGTEVSGNLVVGSVTLDGGGLSLSDSDKVKCGNGDDLQIYHDGSHSYALNTTGNLFLGSNNSVDIGDGDFTEYAARFKHDDAVELYYDHSKKFETTTDGVLVTGRLRSSAAYNVVGLEVSGGASGYSEPLIVKTANGDVKFTVDGDGNVLVGTTSTTVESLTSAGQGVKLAQSGRMLEVASNAEPTVGFNRTGDDGTIVRILGQGSLEGTITVSGSAVSYNGGHLSRWSQFKGLSTTDKSARPTIYQGTVMSNLDDLCVWEGEDNQQLNMTKISDVVGDKDVAGVFFTWDDDDDKVVNDFYVAMTGDLVIRVAASTTVARGDLLISAGDGTAKPQADDIVRSSTIAKIISTNHTATYPDGSKAYPCVLMAC